MKIFYFAGSGSSDIESSESLDYNWTLITPSESNIDILSYVGKNPTFTPDADGVYQFSLVVSDGLDISIDSNMSDINITAVTNINTDNLNPSDL